MEYLSGYRWPGNVRELRNVAERLVLRARGDRITLDALPPEDHTGRRPRDAAAAAASQTSQLTDPVRPDVHAGRVVLVRSIRAVHGP